MLFKNRCAELPNSSRKAGEETKKTKKHCYYQTRYVVIYIKIAILHYYIAMGFLLA